MTEYDLDRLNDELEKKQNRLDEIIEEIEEFENLLSEWYITPEQFFAITYRIRELEGEKEHIEEDIEEINRLIEKVERDLERAEEMDLKGLIERMKELEGEMEEKLEESEKSAEEAKESLDRTLITNIISALEGFWSARKGDVLGVIQTLVEMTWNAYTGFTEVDSTLEEARDLQVELMALLDEGDELIDMLYQLLDELAEVSKCVVCGSRYLTDEMVEFVDGGFICEECQDGECDLCGVGYSTAVGGTSVVKVTATSDCDICTSNEGFYREQPDLESLNHPNCQCDVEEMELCPKCFSEIDFTE